MPLVTFAQLICNMYADPSAWDFEDLRDDFALVYDEFVEATWYYTFERLAHMSRSDLLPECGGITVKAFVRARVQDATQYIKGLSVEDFWAFEFEPSPDFVEQNAELIATVLRMDSNATHIPSIWLEPLGPTCNMCGARNPGQHHTGQLLCENCVDNHFFGCW